MRPSRSISVLLVLPLLFFMLVGCTADQWQKDLTVVYNVIQKDLPIAVQFVKLEHDAGNMSDQAFARFNASITKINTALPIFQAAISSVKDAKGATAVISNLVPVVNELIASSLVIKNPQHQAQALAWANGFALVFNGITALFGNAPPIVVPVVSTAEMQPAMQHEQRVAEAYFRRELAFR